MWHARTSMPNRVQLLLRTWCQQRRLSTAPPATMRAVRVFEPGPAETALNLSDQVSVPELKAGEVLVRNEFSGVNFHDTYTRSGLCAHSHSTQRLPGHSTAISTRRSSLSSAGQSLTSNRVCILHQTHGTAPLFWAVREVVPS